MRVAKAIVACSIGILLSSACAQTPTSPDASGSFASGGPALLTAGGGPPVFLPLGPSSGTPFGMVSDSSGAAPGSESTPLYIKRDTCSPTPTAACQLRTPEGQPVTWGQWNAIEGRLSAKCLAGGTHIVAHFSHAIPNGVYSLWFNGLPLGADDGSGNAVHVSAAGEGQLSSIDPAGCAPANSLLILAYHNDGQLHGAVPGAPTTWVGQLHRFLP